uniref:Uncharacterized protein n=1 Tax=Glossina pallidipes TaxID=7398 RepID=A0A1B0AIM0_GLOPL
MTLLIFAYVTASYGDHNVKGNLSENRFLKNDIQPYLYFFWAFIGNLLLCPIIPADGLPHSELASVAVIFAFIVAFMCLSRNWMVVVSFGVNVLAKYTYEMDGKLTLFRSRTIDVPFFYNWKWYRISLE